MIFVLYMKISTTRHPDIYLSRQLLSWVIVSLYICRIYNFSLMIAEYHICEKYR